MEREALIKFLATILYNIAPLRDALCRCRGDLFEAMMLLAIR